MNFSLDGESPCIAIPVENLREMKMVFDNDNRPQITIGDLVLCRCTEKLRSACLGEFENGGETEEMAHQLLEILYRTRDYAQRALSQNSGIPLETVKKHCQCLVMSPLLQRVETQSQKNVYNG